MDAPIDLNHLRAFALVHQTSSFSAAADRLGVPRSTVSRAVSALEQASGVLLFHRTTRRVAATAAGLMLYERITPALASLDQTLADLPEGVAAPSGTLRVTTTPDLGTALLAHAVARYTARYPDVRVAVSLGGAVVDLVKERFDLALRFAQGPLRGASLITTRLGPVRFHLYAAPSYLARRGVPRSEAELAEHDVVALPRGGAPGGAKPRILCDDKLFAREVLREGGGIGVLPPYLANADVAAGTLVRILPRFEVETGAVHLVQPSRKLVPQRITAFRELLLEILRQRPLNPE